MTEKVGVEAAPLPMKSEERRGALWKRATMRSTHREKERFEHSRSFPIYAAHREGPIFLKLKRNTDVSPSRPHCLWAPYFGRADHESELNQDGTREGVPNFGPRCRSRIASWGRACLPRWLLQSPKNPLVGGVSRDTPTDDFDLGQGWCSMMMDARNLDKTAFGFVGRFCVRPRLYPLK